MAKVQTMLLLLPMLIRLILPIPNSSVIMASIAVCGFSKLYLPIFFRPHSFLWLDTIKPVLFSLFFRLPILLFPIWRWFNSLELCTEAIHLMP
jgi:hypothetical protein